MSRTEAQKRAEKKYQSKFEVIRFRVLPEDKERIFDHAFAMGESVNSFIKRAIDEAIRREEKA